MKQAFAHVHWIGGASGAGKSTIARRLADRYGMRLYDTDEAMSSHVGRVPAGSAPHLDAFAAMDMDQRWVHRTPQDMLATFHWYHGEAFDLIIEDLLALPADRPIIAEGFRLLPELVAPLLDDVRRAVWLLPTPRYRHGVFASRGGTSWGFIARTNDPQRALRNLEHRDALFTERLADETRRLGLPAITVDLTVTDDDLEGRVAGAFGLVGH